MEATCSSETSVTLNGLHGGVYQKIQALLLAVYSENRMKLINKVRWKKMQRLFNAVADGTYHNY
jgi:hypothetical protein